MSEAETSGPKTMVLALRDKVGKSHRSYAILAALWFLATLSAIIASFVSLGMEGDMTAKVAGIFYALILGPFYWIYFAILHSRGQLAVRS